MMHHCLPILPLFLIACGCHVPQPEPAYRLTGQLVLPPGSGARGVEVIASFSPAAGKAERVWLTFDERGRFEQSFDRALRSLEVGAGIGFVVQRFGPGRLRAATANGRIDLGTIDLRGRLARHRLSVRSSDARGGRVRVGMWAGRPPEGVALGSRQFPPIELGSEMEWLVPHDASSICFLVERPAAATRQSGDGWQTGRQQLFGPFEFAELPIALTLSGRDGSESVGREGAAR